LNAKDVVSSVTPVAPVLQLNHVWTIKYLFIPDVCHFLFFDFDKKYILSATSCNLTYVFPVGSNGTQLSSLSEVLQLPLSYGGGLA